MAGSRTYLGAALALSLLGSAALAAGPLPGSAGAAAAEAPAARARTKSTVLTILGMT